MTEPAQPGPLEQLRSAWGDPTPTIISVTQRRVHIAAELVALFVVAPLSILLATRRELPMGLRVLSAIAGLGTLAVDGWLASRYLLQTDWIKK